MAIAVQTTPGEQLKEPLPRSEWHKTELGRFLENIEQRTRQRFEAYNDAWSWSIEYIEEFWMSVWEYFDIITHETFECVLKNDVMPGATWFPGARINYTEHVMRQLRARADEVMLKSRSQTRGAEDWTGARLLEEIAKIQRGLIAAGVSEGDRVVGYLPNIPETVAAYLATAGLGAIWAAVPPEMGSRAALDRIGQLAPTVLIGIDGYRWGDREVSKLDDLRQVAQELQVPTVILQYLAPTADLPETSSVQGYSDFGGTPTDKDAEMIVVKPVPFDHPLTILFSSGTTGKPKGIVHSHGGLLLEHTKAMHLHFDMDETDTAFWFSTTGWMVWTLGVSTLLAGATLVIEDGDPNWPTPDGDWSQWAILAETQATYWGTGSAYLAMSAHSDINPAERWDLSKLREIQCSGSPLAADVAGWIYQNVNPTLLLASTSGGTDICAAFLGGSPISGVYAGEMSCRPLGVAVESWDPDGNPLKHESGELVAIKPMPSMPVFFWGDEDGQRYRSSYFDTYPGVWRHGDWLVHTERDTWVITGRSDATLNRGGVRLGTSEYYALLDGDPNVADSLVLHFEDDGMGKLVLLIKTKPEVETTGDRLDELTGHLRMTIRNELSPRHVPDAILSVPDIPRTSTGKRVEIPLKRIIQGKQDPSTLADSGVASSERDLTEIIHQVQKTLAS